MKKKAADTGNYVSGQAFVRTRTSKESLHTRTKLEQLQGNEAVNSINFFLNRVTRV